MPARPARLSPAEPAKPRELEAEQTYREASCSAATSLWFPGGGQLCQGRTAEGALFASLAAAEIATGVGAVVAQGEGLDGLDHPAVGVSAVALQNLWVYSYADAVFVEQRAARMPFVPMDEPHELALAPFDPNVMGDVDVWLGLSLLLAAGIGVSVAVDESFDTGHAGERPNLFGRELSRPLGYPLAAGVGAGLFEHVALGEESLFRGLIQSSMARNTGETEAWVAASLAFGVAHAPNVAVVPAAERVRYLVVGVPFLTVTGSYLGLLYRWHDYSLAASTAVHFWYDLLLSATFFALDPGHSPLSARVSVPF